MTLAILQCADTGPLESLVVMLKSIGWDCALPDRAVKDALKGLGCDTVMDVESLVANMGYDRPTDLPIAGLADMHRTDVVYVDVKAHRNGPKLWKRWPHLEHRTLWYRINGGKPEHVIRADGFDCGDEVNPPCPVLTPNMWYHNAKYGNKRYVCWPPFHRWQDHQTQRGVGQYANSEDAANPHVKWSPPICLIHSLEGWGYGALVNDFREKLGIRCHGDRSPDGLLNHREVPTRLATALCMVHLKSSDSPGYALYEALASACPVICTRRLIWRCRMQELLIPGKTCLTFDRETHEGLTPEDVAHCTKEVGGHLKTLSDPAINRRIGEAGRQRLKEVMWSYTNKRDVESLREFLGKHFRTCT